jgi:hypothetical protein
MLEYFHKICWEKSYSINPLNGELNPICHLLALLGGATIVVVSSLRVKIGQEQAVLYMKTSIHFSSYLAHFFLEWAMFQKKPVEKITTHVLFKKILFESNTVYEATWKNIVEPGRPQMTIWRLRIARWVSKCTLRFCHIFCFATSTMVARTSLIVTL